MEQLEYENPYTGQKRKNKRTKWFVLGIVALLVICGAAVAVALRPGNSSSTDPGTDISSSLISEQPVKSMKSLKKDLEADDRAASEGCSGTSIMPAEHSKKFEPSDIAWNIHKNTSLLSEASFFVVSDNGKLMETSMDGKVLKFFKVGKKFDLEGVAVVPGKPNVVFLGVEYPAQVMEFDLEKKSIGRTWNVQEFIDSSTANTDPYDDEETDPNNGIEAMVYIEHPASSSGGFFLLGRQKDARVFIFELEDEPVFKGSFQAPGPAEDLSAMTLWKDKIYFLYDKPKYLLSLPVSKLKISATENYNGYFGFDQIDYAELYSMRRRGQEGLAFGSVAGVDYAVFAVDPPSGVGQKDIVKYEVKSFMACFNQTMDEI